MRKVFYIAPSFSGYELSTPVHIHSKVGFVSNSLIGRYVGPSIDLDKVRADYKEKVLKYIQHRRAEGCGLTLGDLNINLVRNVCEYSYSFDSVMIFLNEDKLVSEF